MKKTKIRYMLAALTVISLIVVTTLLFGRAQESQAEQPIYDDLYVCSMHPWQASEGPGSCSVCGMNLSPVHGHQPGTPLPGETDLYVSADNPLYVHEGPGRDPNTGSALILITQSPFYQPRQMEKESEKSERPGRQSESMQQISETGLWTCGMHPEVIQDEPGICPICHMELIPLKSSTASGQGTVVQIDPVTLQNIGVKTESVKRRDLSIEIRSNGLVQIAEDTQVKVNARVSGWVEKLYVARTGDPVKKGQPLLEIYSPELVSAQEEYLLALQSAEALQKNSPALASGDLNDLVAAARRRLEWWEISAQQIRSLEKNRQVRRTMTSHSPANGIVLHKNVVEGAAVNPGMDLFLIADLSEVWVQAQVYEYELPWIRPDDQVEITSAYDPDLQLSGRIDYIYPTVDPTNRAVEVRIVIPNADLRLKPQMYLQARILTSPKPAVLSVPKSAVIRSGQRDLVFVSLGEGRFQPRPVHIGLEADRYYEILHGLDVNEQVVTSAQFLLDSEAKLQEAIQRRLEMRRQISESGAAVETEVDIPTGHVH